MKVCSGSDLKRIQTLWNSPKGDDRFLEETTYCGRPRVLARLAKTLYRLEFALTHKETKAKR